MAVKIVNTDASLGAYIEGVDLAKPLKDSEFEIILKAIYDRQVVFFRGQNVTHEDHQRFAQMFGSLKTYTPKEFGQTPTPNIICVSNVVKDAHLGSGELFWHSDSAYMEKPASLAFLFASEVPPSGGDTFWANMYDAWKYLPDPLKTKALKVKVVHDLGYNAEKKERVLLKNAKKNNEALPTGASHPMVRVHTVTGREALFFGRVYRNLIEGWTPEESTKFLSEIEAFATQERFTHRHLWKKGDFAIWDNSSTMHRRDSFDSTQRRVLYRCEIQNGFLGEQRYKKAA